jgi:LysM repeat protein
MTIMMRPGTKIAELNSKSINANHMLLSLRLTRKLPFKGAFLAIFSLLSFTLPLDAVRNRYYDDSTSNTLREMRDTIEDVRHEVRNHETEIRTFDEKLKNMDVIIDSLRDHITDSSQSHKESLKGSTDTFESKILTLEHSWRNLADDMRQFKTYANDTSTNLTRYNQKIADLEKLTEQQHNNIKHLQVAMQSLMTALQQDNIPLPTEKISTTEKPSKTPSSSNSDRIYIIKSGDSLEKIAKRNQTTVQAIKELNGLSKDNDRIIVGKKLQLPE